MRRAIQDVRGLGHLDHESRPPAGQIVRRADARVDRVERPQNRRVGRHADAAVGEQRHHGRLAHVRRLAAHVGTGDDQQPAVLRQRHVVGNETLDLLLDYRMPAAADRDARLRGKRRARETQRVRAFREIGQDVERGECGRRPLQRRNRRRELVEQLLEQRLLPCERALLRGERLVFEGSQLGGDVALRILERLPAAIIVGNLFDMRVGDFDVEAMHAVVLDLEVGDAGALALTRLQRDQERAAVGVDRAQFVQLGVESRRDDAAIAYQCRGLGRDRAFKQCSPLSVYVEVGGRRVDQRGGDGCRHRAQSRQARQCVAQAGQVARARVAQRDTTDDAFYVDGFLQTGHERACGGGIGAQCFSGVVPRGGLRLRPERLRQPHPQQAAAGRRGAAIEQREERGRAVARQCRRDFEVAARCAGPAPRIRSPFRRSSVRICASADCCVAPA